MLRLNWKTYELKFKHPFTISKGTKTHQPTLIVELEKFGLKGYGEAPAINYYDVSLEKMEQVLKFKKPFIEKFAFTTPDRYWHYLHHLLPVHPFVVCALDMAAWDLYAKMMGKPLGELIGSENGSEMPLCDYTIGIDTIENMVSKMKEHPSPIYKIKLGTKEDKDIVRALRKETDAILRIDANSGWSTEEALENLKVLEECGIEMIEQPLNKDNWEGMKILMKESNIPLIADESCVSENDVEKCSGHFHGINIKLTKCSGITPAIRMIKQARSIGLKVMMGSMNESSVGSAAIAHFLPQLDYVDMDGPLLLEDDLAEGLEFNHGQVSLLRKPGLGVNFNGF